MAMASFDPSHYDTIPQTTAGGIIALVHATLVASKDVRFDSATKALKRLREKGEILRTLHAAINVPQEKSDKKRADTLMDDAWQALGRRLTDYAELPPDFAKDHHEAAKAYEILFPNGMSFVGFPFAEEWAEGEAILRRIADHDLERAINTFAGAPFLARVRARHVEYGEALGITKAKPEVAEQEKLVEPLRETREALMTYSRVVVSAVKNEELDQKVGIAALAPIAELRAQVRSMKRRAVKSAEEAAPPPEPVLREPLPPVD